MKYKIPFSYITNCTITVDADDLDQAINKVMTWAEVDESGKSKLMQSLYLADEIKIDDASVEIDEEKAEKINPKLSYAVRLRKVEEVVVYVQAHNEDDAETLAYEKFEAGEVENFEESEVEAVEVELESYQPLN